MEKSMIENEDVIYVKRSKFWYMFIYLLIIFIAGAVFIGVLYVNWR